MIRKIFNCVMLFLLKQLYFLWRKTNRNANPRPWSNDELKKFVHLFKGDVINVSAGNDADKEGAYYRDYFSASSSYTISNYKKTQIEGYKEIELDLNLFLSADSSLVGGFDVVFSHTVLEHIYDVRTAVANLCRISRDIVITVVPFLQAFHHVETDGLASYHDYWRLSPYTLKQLFKENGFETIYISWNNDPIGNIYIFHIASKKPQHWENIISNMQLDRVSRGPGYNRQLLLGSSASCDRLIIEKTEKCPAV